jgi:hypothetical protein
MQIDLTRRGVAAPDLPALSLKSLAFGILEGELAIRQLE